MFSLWKKQASAPEKSKAWSENDSNQWKDFY